MTTKIKITFMTGIFIFLTTIGIQAQEKYEYACVVYYATPKKGFPKAVTISVSQAGKYYNIESEVKKGEIFENFTPLIEVVNKMATEGWEVYNNNIIMTTFYYYLRRKTN